MQRINLSVLGISSSKNPDFECFIDTLELIWRNLTTMLNSAPIAKFANNFLHISFLAVLILFFAVIGNSRAEAFGQPKLGDSIYKKSDESVKSKTSKTKAKTTVSKPKIVQNEKILPKSVTKVIPKTFIDVTFLAKEPLVEVYLNQKVIGSTDDTLKLSKKLTAGDYLLMAKNKRQVVLSTKKISINSEQNSFKLFEEIVPQPTPVVVIKEKVEEKTDLDKAVEISNEVKRILENYANPATTDSITTSDWELVFKAAQLGQLQNYTAVQIEAQRWFASGQLELSKEEFTNAFTAFNKSQEFMPTSALPFYGLGNTYLAKKQYGDALKSYQRALQLDPKMAMAYKKLGDTQRLSGKQKEAIAAYKSAIQFGYNSLETRFWLATLMLETKQIEEAIKELEAISKEMPKAEVFVSIGNGYEKLKRDVSAIDAYQKAIDADPNSAVAYAKLADVYLNQREYTKAREAYEKAMALDPEGKTINKKETQKKLREATIKSGK